MAPPREKIQAFELPPGRMLAGRYEVVAFLGGGWEGEVYRVAERATGIARAAKVYYPQRNIGDRTLREQARKLDRLRHVEAVVQYHHVERVRLRGVTASCLISEFIEGEILGDFIARQPRGHMHHYEALRLIRSLIGAVEQMHAEREYHGDLHGGNVLVRREGVHHRVKILDLLRRDVSKREAQRDDITDAVRLLYDAVGGRARYAAQPECVRRICRGMRRDLILRQFPTAARLRRHLDTFDWNGG